MEKVRWGVFPNRSPRKVLKVRGVIALDLRYKWKDNATAKERERVVTADEFRECASLPKDQTFRDRECELRDEKLSRRKVCRASSRANDIYNFPKYARILRLELGYAE